MSVDSKPSNLLIIGASAGGLESIIDFFEHAIDLSDFAIIVALHLSPKHESAMDEILQKHTKLEVKKAVHRQKISSGQVYINPAGRDIEIKGEQIILSPTSQPKGPKPSINKLLQSAADSFKGKLFAIILSGTGKDGTIGCAAVKKAGGEVIVQDPEEAKYNGMPVSVIEENHHDLIMKTERMGQALEAYIDSAESWKSSVKETRVQKLKKGELRRILDILEDKTNSSFNGYKESTIRRRLANRMQKIGIHNMGDYLQKLENDPKEANEMFNSILIGVTEFYRNPEHFNALKIELQQYFKKKDKKEFRAWIPACSSGEEAYTIAIIVAELLGKDFHSVNVQIFATDIDEKALTTAREGIYSSESLELIPEEYKERYFSKEKDRYKINKQLRSIILFSRHDFTKDPPFLNLDLVSCRNLLIYFKLELQLMAMSIVHYSLKNGGIFFLGKSEKTVRANDLFDPISQAHRIYRRKNPKGSKALRMYKRSYTPKSVQLELPKQISESQTDQLNEIVKETLFKTQKDPIVIIDNQQNVVKIIGDVRLYMRFPEGEANLNILKLLNPEFQIELRTLLSNSINEHEAQTSEIKRFVLFDQTHYVRIGIKPLLMQEGTSNHYMVLFEKLDIADYVESFQSSNKTGNAAKVKEIQKELDQSKEHLQSYIEELETSNEELQALNEEVQSTSEELQSSNEELETTNEELQSTNEEIEVAYRELRKSNEILKKKEIELEYTKSETEALLNNNLQASILVDANYLIKAFNDKASEVFKSVIGKDLTKESSILDYLRPSELQMFIERIKLSVTGESFEGEELIENKVGEKRWYRVNFNPVISKMETATRVSISMLDIHETKTINKKLKETEFIQSTVFKAANTGICITDEEGVFVDVNQTYCTIYGYKREELIGNHFTMIVHPDHKKIMQQAHYEFINGTKELPGEAKVVRKDGSIIFIEYRAKLLEIENTRFKVTSVNDISEKQIFQNQLSNVADNIPGIIARYELKANGQDRFLFVSNKVKSKWGAEPNKFMQSSKHFWDMVHKEDRKMVSDAFLESAKNQTEVRLEFRRYGKKKSIRWKSLIAQPNAQPNGATQWDCVFLDITNQKEIKESLKDQEILFKKLLENFHGVVLKYRLYSDGKDEMLYISKDVERIQEIPVEKALGKPSELWNQILPEDVEKVQSEVQRSAKENDDYSVSYRIKTKSGKIKWLKGKGKISHQNKEFTEWDTFTWDVTDEMRAEIELGKKNEELNNILDNSQDIICIANHEGQFIKVNAVASQILGYSKEELTSRPYIEFVHPDDRNLTDDEANIIRKKGGSVLFENRYIAKDGSVVWLSWNSIIDEKTGFAYASARDITPEKLAEIEKDYAYQQARLGTWTYDVLHDTVKWSNNTRKLMGFKRTPKSLDSVNKLVKAGKLRESHTKTIQEAIKNQRGWDFETIFRTKHNGERWIRTIGRASITKGKVVKLSGSLQDVHERKITEINLSRLYSEQKDILDSISEAFFSLNYNWEVSYWNKVAERMSDMGEQDVLGKKIWDVYPESNWKPKFLECKRKKKRITFEAYSEYWEIWCRVSVSPVNDGYSVFIQDINDSVEYLQEIKTINERFELALEATKDAIFDWKVDGSQIKWNNAITELSGYQMKELPKSLKEWLDQVQISGDELVSLSLQRAFKNTKRHQWSAQFNAIRKDDKEITVKVEGNIIRDDNGKPIRMVGAASNISAQANYENQLKGMNRELVKKAMELEASNEELEQFAYVASHDLQEPARMITSFMSLLRENYGDQLDEKARQYVDFAADGGKRMRSMINDLLDYSRVGRKGAKAELISLKKIIDEVKFLNSQLIEEKNAKVSTTRLPSIYAPKSVLTQLFGNLISNALHYSKEGVPPEIRISSKSKANVVEIRVSDNGIGIDKKYHDEVFNLFRKLDKKKSHNSTGLGLAIVKKIVKQLEGTIELESEVDNGSTFIISLPKNENP